MGPAIKAIFFDAAGTLLYLPESVGCHYALVAAEVGLAWGPTLLDQAFRDAWKAMPDRPAIDGPRPDDDKGWWRELVNQVIDRVAHETRELDRDAFFEAAYSHFSEAGVWDLYPEVVEVLEILSTRFKLAVVSNFDGRLRLILRQLGVSHFFSHLFISSEIGADKPDPTIYQRALNLSGHAANETLHVGDDPIGDWQAAETAGLTTFRLERPGNSLRDLVTHLHA
jgi:putative hydrolase of the HAD superfamily